MNRIVHLVTHTVSEMPHSCRRGWRIQPVCSLALARKLLVAVARGEPLSEAELYRRLGIEPPPPDAES